MLNSICTSLTDNVCGKYRKVLSDNKFVSSGLFTVTEYYHWIDTIYKLNGDEVKAKIQIGWTKLISEEITYLRVLPVQDIAGIAIDKIKDRQEMMIKTTNRTCRELFSESLICSVVRAT